MFGSGWRVRAGRLRGDPGRLREWFQDHGHCFGQSVDDDGSRQGNRTAQRQAFTQCMQSHGINAANLPRGAFGRGGGGQNSSQSSNGGSNTTGPTTSFTLPPGVTQQQMQSALQACRSLLPAGGRNFQNNPAFAAYRNCLQLHGVTTGTGGGQGLDRTSPTVQAAMQACSALRPAPSSSTSTPPST